MARKKTPQQTIVEIFMTASTPVALLELARSIVKQRFHNPSKPKAKKEAPATQTQG